MAKIEINRRLYWIYANCRDGQNRMNWRPYMLFITKIEINRRLYWIVEMAKIEINRRPYWIMLIIEMAKIEINRRPYWIYANCRDGQNRDG